MIEVACVESRSAYEDYVTLQAFVLLTICNTGHRARCVRMFDTELISTAGRRILGARALVLSNVSWTQGFASHLQQNCAAINLAMPGNSSCPCIPSLQAFGVIIPNKLNVTVRGENFFYSATYGEQGCAAHDVLNPPDCQVVLPRERVANIEVLLPFWCFQPWCYVNGSECTGMHSEPATYEYSWRLPENRDDLHFSYATCDSPDLYTVAISSLAAAYDEIDQRQEWWRRNSSVMFVSIGVGLLLLLLLAYRQLQLRRRRRQHFRWIDTFKDPALPPLHSYHWHLFLSHKWPTGQQQCHCIREKFAHFLPGCLCFLDVYDLKDASKLEQHVAEYAPRTRPD